VLLLFGGAELFLKGGWAMYPLLILSIVSVYVILDRSVYFAKQFPRIRKDIGDALRGLNLLPERLSGELAPQLARQFKQGQFDERGAEAATERDMAAAAQGVSLLDTISQIAPMFGLLGTVSGMIEVFFQVARVEGAINVKLLSDGISEALIATWAGLAVAIIAFIGFRVLRGRLLDIENQMYGHIEDARTVLERRPGGAPPQPAASAVREEVSQARSGR
jgi:biopolymer transport protein ExbB